MPSSIYLLCTSFKQLITYLFVIFIRDETVTVGEKLYEIDCDSSQSVTNEVDDKLGIAVLNIGSKADSSSKQVRVPSIKFLGKQGWTDRRIAGVVEKTQLLSNTDTAHAASPASSQNLQSSSKSPTKPHHAVTVQGGTLRSTYGRGRISNQEIESLLLGGASTAPNILQHSSKKQRE